MKKAILMIIDMLVLFSVFLMTLFNFTIATSTGWHIIADHPIWIVYQMLLFLWVISTVLFRLH